MFRSIIQWFRHFSLINIIFYILILTLAILLYSITFSFISTLTPSSSPNTITTNSSSYKDYFVTLGFLATGLTLTYNIRRNLSEDYFKEARHQLENAYNTLNVHDDRGCLSNERLRWITTARTLIVAENIGKKIILSSHKEIHIEDKQYWRMKFHEIVKDFPEDFYAEDPEDMLFGSRDKRAPLDISSLYVIHRFIAWDDSYQDPLNNEKFSDEHLRQLRRGYPNLHNLLTSVKRIKKEMIERGKANKN